MLLAGLNFAFMLRLEAGTSNAGAVRFSATASMVLWLAMLVCGRFIGFF